MGGVESEGLTEGDAVQQPPDPWGDLGAQRDADLGFFCGLAGELLVVAHDRLLFVVVVVGDPCLLEVMGSVIVIVR